MTSTVATETPSRAVPRWGRLLLVAVAVALVTEVGALALGPHLPPVSGWPGYEYAQHEDQLAALGGDVDVLVLGDSSGGVAIRPDELVEDGVARNGYNYWLGGAPMRSVALLASEVVLERARPETVIVGVTMRNFNDAAGQASHLAALQASSAFREETGRLSWVDAADDWLQARSAIFRHRDILRDPLDLLRQLRSPTVPDRLGAEGHVTDRGGDRLEEEPADHLQQEREAMADYAVFPEDVAALDELLGELQQRGSTVLVVSLPVTSAFIDLAQGGTEDYDRFVSAVSAAAGSNGAHVLDTMVQAWPDELFGDVNHLNDSGAARLRPIVADAIAGLPQA